MSNDRTAAPQKGTKFVCSNRIAAMSVYYGKPTVVEFGWVVEVIDPAYASLVRFKVTSGTEPEGCVSHIRFYDCFVRASSPQGKRILRNVAANAERDEKTAKLHASLDTLMDRNQKAELVKKRTRLKKLFGDDLINTKPIDPQGWPRTGDRFRCTKNVRLSAINGFDYTVGCVVQVEGLELAGGYVRLMNPLTGERTPRVTKNILDSFFTCIDRIEDVVAKDKDVFTADERLKRFDGCNGNIYELDVKCKPVQLNRVVKPGTNDHSNPQVDVSLDTRPVKGGIKNDMLTVSTYEYKVGLRVYEFPVDGLLELLKRSGYVVVTEPVARDMKENDRRKTAKEKREEAEFYETTGRWQG